MMDTTLAQRMIERADHDQLSTDHDMRIKAMKFDEAAKKYVKAEITVKQFLGYYARARRCWCDYSGETLV